MTDINQLFDNMDTWRHLPAYQLERRADIFFSIYLVDLLSERFRVKVNGLIPEFPIRIGTIDPKDKANNRSFKVDYLALAEEANQAFLVELKTDDTSRRSRQDKYLQKAQTARLAKLLEGVRKISAVTASKKKYRYLLLELQRIGLISVGAGMKFEVVNAGHDMRIVYLQPTNQDRQEGIISFQEAAEIIAHHGDALSHRFARSLRERSDEKADNMP